MSCILISVSLINLNYIYIQLSGMCISADKYCDGTPHCSNGEDEVFACGKLMNSNIVRVSIDNFSVFIFHYILFLSCYYLVY